MPEDHRVATGHPVDHRLVGVAHPTRVHVDDGVTRPGRESGDVLEREVLMLFDEDGCADARTVPATLGPRKSVVDLQALLRRPFAERTRHAVDEEPALGSAAGLGADGRGDEIPLQEAA